MFTKTFTIKQYIPFAFGDNDGTRSFFGHISDGNFAVTSINSKATKHTVLELYVNQKVIQRKSYKGRKKLCILPGFGGNLDLWKSKVSNDKYIGVRLYFIDELWEYVTENIAVKLYKPSATVRGEEAASKLVLAFYEAVLDEVGLDLTDLCANTADSGPDVKRALNVLAERPYVWCNAHLVNCALLESFGVTKEKDKSKNKPVRALFKIMRSTIENVNKSDNTAQLVEEARFEFEGTSSKSKIGQAVDHR